MNNMDTKSTIQISLFESDNKQNDINIDYALDYEFTIPVSVGDIWQMGKHRLMCGDATNSSHVKALMGGKKAHLLITDPPYNVNYEGATKDKLTIMNDKMDDSSFRLFLRDSYKNAFDNMTAGSGYYIFHAAIESYNFIGALLDNNVALRQILIWHKNKLVPGRQDYHWIHEPILYGWIDGTHRWYSDRKQRTIMNFDRPYVSELHPTMKPIELYIYLMNNSSKEGDIVLDLFGGSGTIILAAEYNKRRGYAMELDPFYCNVIIQRWQQMTGLKAVKL